MMSKTDNCELCGHERRWHRDGDCQAWTCKGNRKYPPHEFDDGRGQGDLLAPNRKDGENREGDHEGEHAEGFVHTDTIRGRQ